MGGHPLRILCAEPKELALLAHARCVQSTNNTYGFCFFFFFEFDYEYTSRSVLFVISSVGMYATWTCASARSGEESVGQFGRSEVD